MVMAELCKDVLMALNLQKYHRELCCYEELHNKEGLGKMSNLVAADKTAIKDIHCIYSLLSWRTLG